VVNKTTAQSGEASESVPPHSDLYCLENYFDFLQFYFSVQKAKGKTQNLWNIPIEMLCLYRLY